MPLESALDRRIGDLCKRRGAYHEKLHSSAIKPGLPDHLIGYKGHFIYIEAKEGSKLRTLQRLKCKQARARGNIAEVAFDTDIVERIFACIDRGEKWEPETDLDKL